MGKSYLLSLTDGSRRQIHAGTKEMEPVVELLANAMMLKTGVASRSLCVMTAREEQEEAFSVDDDMIVYRFSRPQNRFDLVSRAMKVSLVIAHEVQTHGGVLVHGALAEYEGKGVLFAAPGGTGKTTASLRLPFPWHSLCDDTVLIVRDPEGKYLAHPWPTWSRFYDDGPGGAWDTGAAVPLAALYFLRRSPEDTLEEINPTQAAAMLIDSVGQVNGVFDRQLSLPEVRENRLRQFSIVCALTAALHAYILHLGLTGEFWKLVEESLKKEPLLSGYPVAHPSAGGSSVRVPVMPWGVTLSGNSMYPTLKAPDFLDVEPYNGKNPRRGDVACFHDPVKGIRVVHRIMAVHADGLLTRGDNNSENDPFPVPMSAVEGRVTAVHGQGRHRPVAGGLAGMCVYAYARISRILRNTRNIVLRRLDGYLHIKSMLRFFGQGRLRLRFVLFGKVPGGAMKVFVDDKCIGQYVHRQWHMDAPWRWLVDPSRLAIAEEKYEEERRKWLCRAP